MHVNFVLFVLQSYLPLWVIVRLATSVRLDLPTPHLLTRSMVSTSSENNKGSVTKYLSVKDKILMAVGILLGL